MAQFARPNADVTVGAWTTTPLWQAIDESTFSDADFIASNNNINDSCEVALTDIAQPDTGTCTIRYRYAKSATSGNARTVQAHLVQGTTVLASGTVRTPTLTTFTADSFTVAASSITDPADLRIRFTAGGTTGGSGGNRRSIHISWAELETPNAVVVSHPLAGGIAASSSFTADRMMVIGHDYVYRDVPQTDVNPITNGSAATPGPGVRTIVGSLIKSLARRFRGFLQLTSPTWGSSYYRAPAIRRTNGRAFVALVLPDDIGSTWAMGLATSEPSGDPRTNGYGWTSQSTTGGGGLFGSHAVIIPGKHLDVMLSQHQLRPMHYLAAVVTFEQGAIILLSATRQDGPEGGTTDAGYTGPLEIPAYPDARVLWVSDSNTTPWLYPYFSAEQAADPVLPYPHGHAFEDPRVIDIPSWATDHEPSTFIDRITRADSTTSPGGSFTAGSGTWGVSNNKLYLQTLSGFSFAWADSGLTGDGIWRWRMTFDSASATAGIGAIFRRVDNNNFLRLWTNNVAGIVLQSWVAGAFGETIYQTGFTWTVGQTYDIVVLTKGNQYRIFIDANDQSGGAWITDSNNRHLTGSGFGPYAGASTDARWDDFIAYPHTVSLPTQLRVGAHPDEYSGTATVNQDTFTDTNGTGLDAHTAEKGGAWIEHSGVWAIQSNAVTITRTGNEESFYATQAITPQDYEATIVVTTPASFPNDTMYVGATVRYQDASNFVHVRLFMNPTQVGSDEIEIARTVGGAIAVVKKVNLADYFQTSSTYTLIVQVRGDLINVFLDGQARMSWIMDQVPTTGRVGLYWHGQTDNGVAITSFEVKPLPLSGDLVATSTFTGDLSVGAAAHPLEGGIAASSALTATTITVGHPLQSEVFAESALTAMSLTVGHALIGSIDASSAMSATTLTVGHALSGAIDSVSSFDATRLTLSHPLAGAIAASSTLVGERLTVGHALVGAIGASSAFTGDLTVGGATHELAGTIAASSSFTASRLTLSHPLAGIITASSQWTGAIASPVALAGTISITSAFTASQLRLAQPLAGQIIVVSALAGILTGLGDPVWVFRFGLPEIVPVVRNGTPMVTRLIRVDEMEIDPVIVNDLALITT